MSVPLTATVLLSAACYSATCYAITKTCEFLCTRPVIIDGVARFSLNQLREQCANFQESVARFVGERNWQMFSVIILDNAWISTFVMTLFILLVPIPDTWEAYCHLIAMFPMTAGAGFAIRVITHLFLPPAADAIAQFVAPRRV